MAKLLKDKSILVTGACGTVGGELVKQLLSNTAYAPREVIGIDNNESLLFFLDQQYLADTRARFFVSDIRDKDALSRHMKGIDIVFHTAALKHVILCERSPDQAVQTNIIGIQNIIMAATENGVERVVFTSSDKAVNPTNVMGTSKLMGERLMVAANSTKRGKGPIFTSTRFGNVLGSNGSVVPIFHNQIARGGPVTVTHPDMTRFIMSLDEALGLVIDSCGIAQGGDVFITKMLVVRIVDLARAMIEELAPRYGYRPEDIATREIGIKPGEKIYEELMSSEETRRAVELKNYFVLLPAFRGMYHNIPYNYEGMVSGVVTKAYTSADETPLSVDAIRVFLKQNNLLGEPSERTDARYWPGDKEEK